MSEMEALVSIITEAWLENGDRNEITKRLSAGSGLGLLAHIRIGLVCEGVTAIWNEST